MSLLSFTNKISSALTVANKTPRNVGRPPKRKPKEQQEAPCKGKIQSFYHVEILVTMKYTIGPRTGIKS